jgi:FixJ family two-component response regulator
MIWMPTDPPAHVDAPRLASRRMSDNPANRLAARATTSRVSLRTIEKLLGMPVATARERFARLTERERQVAVMIAKEKLNREIAAELGITVKTVDIHRSSVKAKLHAYTLATIANVVNLVRLADEADD